jgi:hypothetical protein
MSGRTWQDNAAEFGALVKQGKDVRLALLVACSVEPGKGNGGDRRSSDFQAREHVPDPSEKASMGDFARLALGAETARDRVSRHFKVWERMAAANTEVPAAETLVPNDAATFGEVSEKVQELFAEEFLTYTTENPTGGRPRDSKPTDAAKIIELRGAEAVVAAMTPEVRDSLLGATRRAAAVEALTGEYFSTADVDRMRSDPALLAQLEDAVEIYISAEDKWGQGDEGSTGAAIRWTDKLRESYSAAFPDTEVAREFNEEYPPASEGTRPRHDLPPEPIELSWAPQRYTPGTTPRDQLMRIRGGIEWFDKHPDAVNDVVKDSLRMLSNDLTAIIEGEQIAEAFEDFLAELS